MTAYEELLEKAYELYKRDWCKVRGYDYPAVQEAFDQDEEYNGEMFCSLGEFGDCEFLDEDYLRYLIGDELDTAIRKIRAEERQPLAIKNLAEFKRQIKPGVELVATYHAYHPDIVGLTRVVTKVQTNGFYSVIKDQPDNKWSTCNEGKGIRSDFEKAGNYRFDGSSITVLNSRRGDGSVLYQLEIYGIENQMINTEEFTMSEYERLHHLAERHRENYPPGTRLMLLHMNDPFAPVESGTRGTVAFIDDMAQIHMKWDNGRTLPLNSDEDSFRPLTSEELAEEQDMEGQDRMADEDENMGFTMGM